MQTTLAAAFKDTAHGAEAERILRACVHCGFCNATCPTYQLLGDELDGPRGRIYQIKQVLEGAPATRSAQLHLDRCLTCRHCESTCPSGVAYGRLLEIGRAVIDRAQPRPFAERLVRGLIRSVLSRRALFAALIRCARVLRFAAPPALRGMLAPPRAAGVWPRRVHPRRVLLLYGCVQEALAPSIDAASARVLDAIGVQALRVPESGCCGALRQHLGDLEGARANARANIDAWWPELESGAIEAIVINASACALSVKEYGHLLADDPRYAESARRISQRTRELAEFLAPELPRLRAHFGSSPLPRVVYQKPCTQQHGLRLGGEVSRLLTALGVPLADVSEPQLCCGSAGSYSLLQSSLSRQLRERKIESLMAGRPQIILSGNIGCITHLGAAAAVPVWHWIEYLDRALKSASSAAQ